MKKQYQKPKVMFENLAFNEKIASCQLIQIADCEWLIPSAGNVGCGFEFEEDKVNRVYVQEELGCIEISYCYHISMEQDGWNMTTRS